MSFHAGKFYGSRRDANHRSVELWFHRNGCDTADTSSVGAGFPDLVVGDQGFNYLVDVKNPKTAYGRRGLNKKQQTWARKWRGGPVYTAGTEREVEELVERWRRERDQAVQQPR